MDDRSNLPQFPRPQRRFVYRDAEADTSLAHPPRRRTDQPRPFRAVAGLGHSTAVVLKFRIYLKVN